MLPLGNRPRCMGAAPSFASGSKNPKSPDQKAPGNLENIWGGQCQTDGHESGHPLQPEVSCEYLVF